MLRPVSKQYSVWIIYLHGIDIEFETNLDVLAESSSGREYIKLEDCRRINLTSIERVVTVEN
ncbi:hypothetical protein JFL43_03025 [Viridibacillus sp. YIM B01967]|uniref:Uncharacterized protein n=1 Tax=Viridibacillus soli TaxID=2798301 RepID=A0ABS1H368_9BACL|nr:hypothetical protein [Viridibacillus soli]MBK3493847.1 hypothetical protein [Viridibacillus soli]